LAFILVLLVFSLDDAAITDAAGIELQSIYAIIVYIAFFG